jgi:selenocysteine lyase/cysteine desulfurase
MTSRREFMAGAAATLLWPRRLERMRIELEATQDPWARVRSEFMIPPERIYLNIGTLGPQPRVVFDAVTEHARRVAMSLPPGVDWDTLKKEVGQLLNCDPQGLVFPRNTTEE